MNIQNLIKLVAVAMAQGKKVAFDFDQVLFDSKQGWNKPLISALKGIGMDSISIMSHGTTIDKIDVPFEWERAEYETEYVLGADGIPTTDEFDKPLCIKMPVDKNTVLVDDVDWSKYNKAVECIEYKMYDNTAEYKAAQAAAKKKYE